MKITETKRLIIRQLELDDTEFILELVNSPNWIEFIGNRGIDTLALAKLYILNQMEDYDKNGFSLYVMILKENKTPIGLCGFLQREYLDNTDIGFAILPNYEGKGYTFEACQAIIEYGINVLKLNSIYAITSQKNIKSQKLLKKIGLNYISTIQPKNENKKLLLFKLRQT